MSTLLQANELINGERQEQYGNPSDNLGAISGMWEIYLHKRGLLNINGAGLLAEDVCSMMALLKICRLANDVTHTDSAIDAAGYIGLMEKCNE